MIVTKETFIHNSIEEVYNFLLDVNNYINVLPESTSDFHTIDSKTFVMRINKNVPLRSATIYSTIVNKQIVFKSEDYLDMTVTIDLIDIEKKKSKAILTLKINNITLMGKMVGTNYAKKFLNRLAKKVKKIK